MVLMRMEKNRWGLSMNQRSRSATFRSLELTKAEVMENFWLQPDLAKSSGVNAALLLRRFMVVIRVEKTRWGLSMNLGFWTAVAIPPWRERHRFGLERSDG